MEHLCDWQTTTCAVFWFLPKMSCRGIQNLIAVLPSFPDQAKQQRLDENVSLEEPNYATFEMRQSRRGTLKSQRGTMRSTTSRKTNHTTATSNNFAMINGARIPPRPTPSLVRYSDEDDSARGYDENPDDSDSLTEKPSEISSTDSQVWMELDSHKLL